jgi:uncharacterized SAM-binding protein YcdF (DUF218 family)
MLLFISGGAWLPAIGRWLVRPVPVNLRHADAIIVHGGNPVRTEYAIELYRRGLAPELWHTSYANREELTTKVVVADAGVPLGAFHYLATTSTWSDGHEIDAVIRARKLHSVIIVTDWWHSRRALCSTEQQLDGYDVDIAFAPAPAPAGPENWGRDGAPRQDVVSELIKFVYYALRYGMSPWGC